MCEVFRQVADIDHVCSIFPISLMWPFDLSLKHPICWWHYSQMLFEIFVLQFLLCNQSFSVRLCLSQTALFISIVLFSALLAVFLMGEDQTQNVLCPWWAYLCLICSLLGLRYFSFLNAGFSAWFNLDMVLCFPWWRYNLRQLFREDIPVFLY